MRKIDIAELKGKIFISVTKHVSKGEDEIIFKMGDGNYYKMLHSQDCYEDVYIEDICGDLQWLVDSPILTAEKATNHRNPKLGDDSITWTFYKLATIKGYVTIRWYGTSNGYYSEEVDMWYHDTNAKVKPVKQVKYMRKPKFNIFLNNTCTTSLVYDQDYLDKNYREITSEEFYQAAQEAKKKKKMN